MDQNSQIIRHVPWETRDGGIAFRKNGPGISYYALAAILLFVGVVVLLTTVICCLRIRIYRQRATEQGVHQTKYERMEECNNSTTTACSKRNGYLNWTEDEDDDEEEDDLDGIECTYDDTEDPMELPTIPPPLPRQKRPKQSPQSTAIFDANDNNKEDPEDFEYIQRTLRRASAYVRQCLGNNNSNNDNNQDADETEPATAPPLPAACSCC